MLGITLTSDQVQSAPTEVRQWIEQQVMADLGLGAALAASTLPPKLVQPAHLVACSLQDVSAVMMHIRGMNAAVDILFEFAGPAMSFGNPPVMTYRLIELLHHTRLESIEQVIECLEAINQALALVRNDPTGRFCDFDRAGHCFIAPETHASIGHLWRMVIAAHQGPTREEAA